VAKYIHEYKKMPGGVVRMVESHFEGQPLSKPYMLKSDQSFKRDPLSQLRKLDEFLKDYRGQKAPGSIIVFDTLIVVWWHTNVYGPHQY
jgi:hypothetical protein